MESALSPSSIVLFPSLHNRCLLGSGSVQSRGLTILLVSKLFNTLRPETDGKELDHYGILPEQRALAEIAEIIHSAYVINLGIVNVNELHSSDHLPVTEEDMYLGNKIAILSGDYLLARACTGLAQLHNNQVRVQLLLMV